MDESKDTRRSHKRDSPSILSPVIRGLICGAIRREWTRHSHERKECLNNARSEHEKLNKDGTVSLRNAVVYRCNICNCDFSRKDIEVDHVQPIGRLPDWPPTANNSWETWLKGLWCPASNLQVACKPCHRKKTKDELNARLSNNV